MLDVRSSICYNFCKALCEGLVNKDGYIDEVDAHMKGPRGLILKGKGRRVHEASGSDAADSGLRRI